MNCTCREIGGLLGFSSVMLIDGRDSFSSVGDFPKLRDLVTLVNLHNALVLGACLLTISIVERLT